MKISGLIWLAEIVDKLDWKHNVQQQEVREVFRRKPKCRFVEKGHRRGETSMWPKDGLKQVVT